jgi:hypothetical protein
MEVVPNQQPEIEPPRIERLRNGKRAKDRKAYARSRVENSGGDLLPNVDGRGLIARRFREIAGAILTDQGGHERCSESRKQLIRRFSAACVMAEQLEARLANGESINVQDHAQLCSTLVRITQRIGINRVPKNVTPTLADYLDLVEREESVS